jgi:hypothetical protein
VGLGVLGLPTFLVSMDFPVLYLAVPHLSATLAPSGILSRSEIRFRAVSWGFAA